MGRPAGRFRLAPTLTLTIASDGTLLASTATTRTKLGLDSVVVLCAFARPATLDEAYPTAAETFELARADFDAMVDALVDAGALIAAGATGGEVVGLEAQLAGLRDLGWLLGYRSAIERAARDKIVVDITPGLGLLAVIAARAGARRVYAIVPAGVAPAVQEILVANRVDDRVVLVSGNSDELELPERGELLIHDLASASPFRALDSLARIRERLLVPGARLLPHRLELSFVGVDVTHPEELVEDHLVGELSRLTGLDLSALAARLARSHAKRPMTGPVGPLLRHVITDEVPFATIDLQRPEIPSQPVALDFTITAAYGRLAGVAGLVRAHLDDQLVIGNHPALPSITARHAWYGLPTSQAMFVQAKDRMALVARVDGTEIVVELA